MCIRDRLFITGKGRCNVTNGADMDVLFQNVCTNEKFLYSAFYSFDNTQVCDPVSYTHLDVYKRQRCRRLTVLFLQAG